MNPNIIAGLINRLYENFDMFSFENRLKLQKFIYIMQNMHDLNLGYEFNWYHYGPYCSELAKDGFGVDFSEVPKIKFGEEGSENRFEEFLQFVKDKTAEELEIVASIDFLNKLGMNKEDTINTIKSKREELGEKEDIIVRIYEETL